MSKCFRAQHSFDPAPEVLVALLWSSDPDAAMVALLPLREADAASEGGDTYAPTSNVTSANTVKHSPRTRSCSLTTPAPTARPCWFSTSASEARALRVVDAWLGQLFTPERIAETVDDIHAALSAPDPAAEARATDARRRLDEAEAKIATLRRAIESGADAALVAEWTADARKDRDAARRLVAAAAAVREPPSRDEIATVLARLSTVADRLGTGVPIAARRKLYTELGLRIVVTPGASTLKALVGGAGANGSVGGGT